MGAIEDYIKNKIDQGFSSELIRRELLNNYSKEDVDKAFASYKGKPDHTWAWYIVGIVAVIFVAALVLKITPSGDQSVAETADTYAATAPADVAEPQAITVDGPNCDEYCGKIMSVCAGDIAQYSDERTCILQCLDHLTAAGTVDDYSDNTIGCRIVHTGNAERSDPEVHCYHAGLSGGNICGTWCDNYCSLSASVCAGGDALYGSQEECLGACQSFSDVTQYGEFEGDTVQCRLEQLRLAIDDVSLCTQAAPESEICAATAEPSCDEYCGRAIQVCGTTGVLAQYESERACLDFCAAEEIPVGTRDDITGNSLGCRLSHLVIAETVDKTIHCPHTGKTGAEVCSDSVDLEPLSTVFTESGAEDVIIHIVNMTFTPARVEVVAGTMVTWINEDPYPHRVTDRYGYIRSPTLYEGERFSMVFSEPGEHTMNCAIHPEMQHTIYVVA